MYKTNKRLKNLILPSSQEAIDNGMEVIKYQLSHRELLALRKKQREEKETKFDNHDTYGAEQWKLMQQMKLA